jgi:high-affinity nickel permease
LHWRRFAAVLSRLDTADGVDVRRAYGWAFSNPAEDLLQPRRGLVALFLAT